MNQAVIDDFDDFEGIDPRLINNRAADPLVNVNQDNEINK